MTQPTTATPDLRLADWAMQTKRSPLQDMLVMTARPNLISFGLGLPNQDLFPREAFAQAAAHALHTEPRTLQYGPTTSRLKQQIVELMTKRGVTCTEANIFLTAGAQQGINLLTRLLLEPGGQVMLEDVSYTGFRQVLEPYGPEMLTVPTDSATGIDVDAVEALLEEGARPAFLYCVTDGNNPLGLSLSVEKRQRLVELARRYRMPILEDDPYGFLCYEQTNIPPLRALDDEWVFYVGSFSKILAPGVRTGWAVVPEWLLPKISSLKEATDIDTATFGQHTITAYAEAGHLWSHIERLRHEYGSRRDTMLQALAAHFPEGASWQTPRNGMFIWVELPQPFDVAPLLVEAVEEEQVAFFPGQVFASQEGISKHHCMRLNFSNSTHEQIEEGIARLGKLIAKRMR